MDTDPSEHLNEKVELVGVAENAKSGAVVVLSTGEPVYIKNLDYWDEGLYKKRIKVTGLLRKQKLVPDPVVNIRGEVSAGAFGMSLVLEEAKWEVV